MIKDVLVHVPTERPVRSVVDGAVSLAAACRAHVDAVAVGYVSESTAYLMDGGAALASEIERERQSAAPRPRSVCSKPKPEPPALRTPAGPLAHFQLKRPLPSQPPRGPADHDHPDADDALKRHSKNGSRRWRMSLSRGLKSYQMIKRSEPWSNRSVTSRLAHIVERTGLALAGGSCGLFVAAHVARADVGLIETSRGILAMMIYGGAGFYLGIDLPRPAQRLRELSLRRFDPHPDVVELLSTAGTFLTAVAAVVSVASIILDEVAQRGSALTIGLAWAIGASMQIAAGIIARCPRFLKYGDGAGETSPRPPCG
jgi:hypothetical protein